MNFEASQDQVEAWLLDPETTRQKIAKYVRELQGSARKHTLEAWALKKAINRIAVNPGAITNIAKQLLETGGPGEVER